MRKATYERAGHRCEICGDHGGKQGRKHRVEAHEVWSYDDDKHVQTLVRMIALCPLCHSCKHIGFSSTRGVAYMALCIEHLMKVNGWSEDHVERQIEAAFDQWDQRSRHQWTVDISALRSLLPEMTL